jgi:preprotein translocase subunit Sss1
MRALLFMGQMTIKDYAKVLVSCRGPICKEFKKLN